MKQTQQQSQSNHETKQKWARKKRGVQDEQPSDSTPRKVNQTKQTAGRRRRRRRRRRQKQQERKGMN